MKGRYYMKIYSFDGKKRFTDNFDDDISPFSLGQNFKAGYIDDNTEEIDEDEEKQIEN